LENSTNYESSTNIRIYNFQDMEGITNNKYFVSYVCLALLTLSFRVSLADASSVIIQENASATADTGGNVVEGAGEIKTGNASASSSSSTTVSGNSGGETKVEVKTKAEANGKKVEAEVKEENLKENVSIKKEVKEGGSEAKVEIDVTPVESDPAIAEKEDQEEVNSPEMGEPVADEKNIFARTAESISETARSIFERVVSLFS